MGTESKILMTEMALVQAQEDDVVGIELNLDNLHRLRTRLGVKVLAHVLERPILIRKKVDSLNPANWDNSNTVYSVSSGILRPDEIEVIPESITVSIGTWPKLENGNPDYSEVRRAFARTLLGSSDANAEVKNRRSKSPSFDPLRWLGQAANTLAKDASIDVQVAKAKNNSDLPSPLEVYFK